jgi:hypothetical protein
MSSGSLLGRERARLASFDLACVQLKTGEPFQVARAQTPTLG